MVLGYPINYIFENTLFILLVVVIELGNNGHNIKKYDSPSNYITLSSKFIYPILLISISL